MAAILVEITPQSPRVRELRQQLIFFIGPSTLTPLCDMGDYARREAEAKAVADVPEARLQDIIGQRGNRASGTEGRTRCKDYRSFLRSSWR
jgi:hypothetical protein